MGERGRQIRLWALAAGANLTRPRGDRLDTLALSADVARARETLEAWWDIGGREAAVSTLAWLRAEGHTVRLQEILRALAAIPAGQVDEYLATQKRWQDHHARFAWAHRDAFRDGRLEAFDMVRLSFVARAAFTAGYLDERTAWEAVLEAARRLQAGYTSWTEMSESYLLGRRFWAGGDPGQQKIFDRAAQWLATSPESPWQRLPWTMSLKLRFWER